METYSNTSGLYFSMSGSRQGTLHIQKDRRVLFGIQHKRVVIATMNVNVFVIFPLLKSAILTIITFKYSSLKYIKSNDRSQEFDIKYHKNRYSVKCRVLSIPIDFSRIWDCTISCKINPLAVGHPLGFFSFSWGAKHLTCVDFNEVTEDKDLIHCYFH